MQKIDRCFVRNQGYTRSNVGNVERHNERKNQHYGNGDVVAERTHYNVHFKKCEGTYLSEFDRLVEDGTISTWNLKRDPKIVCEMIFDVNSEYFERRGGYEFAKKFYEDAYRFAVAEAGGEEFVLSAVMHADERNKALSEQLGRDVYHYHLHVMYIPVVDAEIRWTKRCKDPELVGKVKAVVKQVSNSKKWKSDIVVCDDGKKQIAYSYTALQDRFHQHVVDAGYTDVERGERGSSAEHLSVLDFKIQQDTQRLAATQEQVQQAIGELSRKQSKIATADKLIAAKDKKLAKHKTADADISFVDTIGDRRDVFGRVVLTNEEAKSLQKLAKEGVAARGEIHALQFKVMRSNNDCSRAEKERDDWQRQYHSLNAKARPYLDVERVAPERVRLALDEVMRQHRELERERQQHRQQTRQRSSSLAR